MKPKFVRSDNTRHSRLGKNRPKLLKWRRPRGRHNKIRRKRFGYNVQPGVGFCSPKSVAGKINGKIPVLVHNLKDFEKLTKENVIILARVGAKKKIDLIKKAQEMKIEITNMGVSA